MSNYKDIEHEIFTGREEAFELRLFRENLKIGDEVEFRGSDSCFSGRIVCIFTKLNGISERICVEDSRGVLLIKNRSHALKPLDTNTTV